MLTYPSKVTEQNRVQKRKRTQRFKGLLLAESGLWEHDSSLLGGKFLGLSRPAGSAPLRTIGSLMLKRLRRRS